MNQNYMNQTFGRGSMFNLPPAVKNLLIINILFYLAKPALSRFGISMDDILGLHYVKSSHFYFFQYITYMFVHANFTHILFNMLALWMFGYTLENIWGTKRFLFFYLFCGIGAGIIQTLVVGFDIHQLSQGLALNDALIQYTNNVCTIGASGAIYGLLLAFGMSFPNSLIYVYFVLPIKAKYFVIIFGLIELFSGITGTEIGVAHFAHLGGILFGLFLMLYWRKFGSKL